MKKSLESLGGLILVAGVAGLVHRFAGFGPFGFVARVTRATPFIRDHEVVTYVVLLAVALAVFVVADKVEPDESAEPDNAEEPQEGR
jgi:hypothetical protein